VAELAIQTDHLTYDFGSKRAIDGVTIQVPTGIVYGLLGPNGAGKTTMIRLLLGLLEPSEGDARVLNLDTRKQGSEIRARTGVLLESDRLYENLTATENLDYYGRIWQMSPAERQVRSQELLSALDLWDRRDETVGTWSRGMKQKLAIARALFHRPELVFMDEPTSGLDPVASAHLHDQLLTLAAREGTTVFLTTHKLLEAERLCAMVGVIRDGRLLAAGATSELRSLGGVPLLQISGEGFSDEIISLLARRREVANIQVQQHRILVELADAGAHSSPLISLLVESGADIEEVHRTDASLESIFLTMMQEEAGGELPLHARA
jgi:ABC-2 type transport system ATP-binding protein